MTALPALCAHGQPVCLVCYPLPLPIGTYCGHCGGTGWLRKEYTWIEVRCERALAMDREAVAAEVAL